MTFNPKTKIWKCLGTGFFINPYGGFISARHVFQNSDHETEPTLYGIQRTTTNEIHVRPVKSITVHESVDIIIGLLGKRRIPNEKEMAPTNAPIFKLDFSPLKKGDKIFTYAFPNTEVKGTSDGKFDFKFSLTCTEGIIEDEHERSPVVPNRCYQTNMEIKSGASGGPVIKDNYVVAINSSGYDLEDGEQPLSFITPIDFIKELNVISGEKEIQVADLIKNGDIKIKTMHKNG